MGETQDKVDKLLSQFEGLDLNEKFQRLYEELLYERYGLTIFHEGIQEYEESEMNAGRYEHELLVSQIEDTDLTYKELLFICKATGIIDALLANHYSNRSITAIIALMANKHPQVAANAISESPNRGTLDTDYLLATREQDDLFAKLSVFDRDARFNPIKKRLEEWVVKVILKSR
jgi:hypothetical protein